MVVRAVKNAVRIPVWVKFLWAVVFNNPGVALKIEEAGADAVVSPATMPNEDGHKR